MPTDICRHCTAERTGHGQVPLACRRDGNRTRRRSRFRLPIRRTQDFHISRLSRQWLDYRYTKYVEISADLLDRF